MPRSKAKNNATPEWKGFVDCNLDKSTKEKAKEWIRSNMADLMSKIPALVDDGYKVAFSLDRYHDAYQASLTYQVNGHANSGLTLTARGPEMETALGMLLYKHFVILDGNWGSGVQRTQDKDPWG